MQKDFEAWHKIKEKISNQSPISFYYQEREIWWCSLGVNVGCEQDGKGPEFQRPILVFKKFNREALWALPLTLREKKNKFHHKTTTEDGAIRYAILSQLCLLDSRRLIRKVGTISFQNHSEIQKAVTTLMTL